MALRTMVATAVGAVVLATGGVAAAATLEEVADALRRDPVAVVPEAERAIEEADAADLRAAIRDAGTPIFVAVVPGSLGPADAVLDDLRRQVGLAGTYAVVAGDAFRAGSDVVDGAEGIATSAFQRASSEGAAAVLAAFVDGIAQAADGGGTAPARPAGDDGDDGASPLPLLVIGGAVVGGIALLRRRGSGRERAAARAEYEADRQLIQAELSVLADDVLRLESSVAINEAARPDYEAAVARYRAAEAALDYADDAVDLVRVERVLEEGRYAMSRARAIVDGREPPPPSAELRRPGRHDEPPLEVDARGEPAYVGYGGPFYGGGWFGGGSGLFTGLLLGHMLGGFGGWHHGDTTIVNDGGDGGWGDVGGGDFGGDFGGGDW